MHQVKAGTATRTRRRPRGSGASKSAVVIGTAPPSVPAAGATGRPGGDGQVAEDDASQHRERGEALGAGQCRSHVVQLAAHAEGADDPRVLDHGDENAPERRDDGAQCLWQHHEAERLSEPEPDGPGRFRLPVGNGFDAAADGLDQASPALPPVRWNEPTWDQQGVSQDVA